MTHAAEVDSDQNQDSHAQRAHRRNASTVVFVRRLERNATNVPLDAKAAVYYQHSASMRLETGSSEDAVAAIAVHKLISMQCKRDSL